MTICGASSRLQYVMKIYLVLAWNNREEIRGKEFSTKTYKIAYSPSQEGWRGDGQKTRLRSWKLLSFLSLRITWGLYVGIKFGKIDIAHLVCKLQAKVWNVPFFPFEIQFPDVVIPPHFEEFSISSTEINIEAFRSVKIARNLTR